MLSAPGAGDGNLPLPFRDADSLLAFRAMEIAVIAVLEPVEQLKVSSIFQIPLVMIAGEHSEQSDKPKCPDQNADDSAAQEKI